MQTFKICVFGETSGKTTFIRRYITGEFNKNHTVTDVEEHLHTVWTSEGPVLLHLLDCGDSRVYEADAGICFACTPESTKQNRSNFEQVAGKVPVVVVWDACDLSPSPKWCGNAIPISKTWKNIGEPFIVLLRQLMNNPELQLVESPAVVPPLISV